jgi:lysophospholipase L1-like esterase
MRLMLLALLGVILRLAVRLRRLPANRPAAFRGQGAVVCLGASTVQGNVSYNWVDELARRLPDRTFVNAGVNGETSAQVLARVPEVVACRPTDVVVMIGANDLFAIRGSRLAGGRHTTFDEYRANLSAIVRELRPARVALLSIQPLGERLDSPENQDMDRLNEIVYTVAAEEGAAYLPFNERLKDLIHDGDRPFQDSPARVLLAIALRLGVGVSVDRIGRTLGYRAHTEGLHLASPAGLLVADLAEEFLKGSAPRSS